jgi:peptidoglycan-associated lipoprotein
MKRIAILLILTATALGACAKKQQPVAAPAPPPVSVPAGRGAPPPPPQPVDDRLPVPPQPIGEDAVGNRSLDDLNRDSPLRPAFFQVDSFELDNEGRAVVSSNAELLKRYPTWTVTIEGHCDERGTAEYNLALGERRALAVRTYLLSLGIAPARIRTVSYGKEFPFDPAHSEGAYAKNRRAHFVITSK